MKVLSLFSGIGAFEKALKNLGVDVELVGFCEIDKHATKSYCAIHSVSEEMNLGDITKIDSTVLPKDIDLISYGFPCQDISLSGKQKSLLHCDVCGPINNIPEDYVKKLKSGEKLYCVRCGNELKTTRSGLFFEALRIIEDTKPKIAIAENVKNLTSKKFSEQFRIVLGSLEQAGYNNYWAVLNSKHYGIPQNRERVFIVSIRKDIDSGTFKFPDPIPLDKRLKDVLESEVDERYYLTEDQMKSIIQWKAQQKPFERVLGKESISPTLTARGAGEYHSGMIIYSPDNEDTCNMQTDIANKFGIDKSNNNPSLIDVANCITAREDRGVSNRKGEGTAVCEILQVGQLYPDGDNPQAGRVYDPQGISPTLDTCSGGNRMPKIIQKICNKIFQRGRGFNKGGEKDICPTISTHSFEQNNFAVECLAVEKDSDGPLVWDGYNQRIRADQSTIGTLTQNCGKDLKRNGQGIIESFFRIRKLTPKECFRLMGFDDEAFEKAKWYSREESAEILKRFPKHKGKRKFTEEERIERMSDTQLYKQAGNSIVVDVLEAIFRQMLDENGNFII